MTPEQNLMLNGIAESLHIELSKRDYESVGVYLGEYACETLAAALDELARLWVEVGVLRADAHSECLNCGTICHVRPSTRV